MNIISQEPYPDGQRFAIFQAAIQLFLKEGFGQTSMGDIARALGLDVHEIYKYFGNKEDIIFHLYRTINNDWETEVANLHQEKLPERFRAAIYSKLQLIAPYKDLLRNLLPVLLNDDALGVFSPENQVTRTQGLAIINTIMADSKGPAMKGRRKAELSKTLYFFHWTILFLSLHESHDTKALKILDTFSSWLSEMNLAKKVLLPFLLPRMTELSGIMLEESTPADTQAKSVLDIIFNKRKLIPGSGCEKKICDQCYGLHLPRVQYFIDSNRPVHIILPAFPAKSPNKNKVLGTLPDLGEEIALLSLQSMCEDIARVYKPGAEITICADGRLFADLVQVSDEEVTAYTTELRHMITALRITAIEVVNLEDLVTGMSFDNARAQVIQQYAEDTTTLREKIKQSEQYKAMFNGMHRFISDDRAYAEPDKSKSRIKEEAKDIAVGVIQRSNAWTRFLGHYYPHALRLSIHPQLPHSEKIGIRLTKAVDEWITPWHGVIVLKKDNYTLMKKQDAEKMGAVLFYKDGKPSHYTLNPGD